MPIEETLASLVKSRTAVEKEILAVAGENKRLQLENLLTADHQESLKELKRQGRPDNANRPSPPDGAWRSAKIPQAAS